MNRRKVYTVAWDGHTLELGHHTRIMGILNVTPDSFSDGGKFYTTDAAVAHGLKLAEAGADILDIGGESTRPFSEPVSIDEEIRRVVPVIEQLAPKIAVPISIDTTKAKVAQAAIAAGASIINDISSLQSDPEMVTLAAKSAVPVILMHMKGAPKNMQVSPTYDDVVAEIKRFLEDAIDQAQKNGISQERIIVDPGIGFGKTVDHNLQLIYHLNALQTLDVPILIGPSRKSFIQNI
ncbi:MAG: dihydropteroate synthase, partial [Desulfobacterales bacterium]